MILAPSQAIRIRRTPHSHGYHSPFVLDPASITYNNPTQMSKPHQPGIWLHTSVLYRRVSARSEVYRLLHYMSQLRHPNVEQLVGVVIEKNVVVSQGMSNGMYVQQWLQRDGWRFRKRYAHTVVRDVARALVYLHEFGEGVGVDVDSVVFDGVKAVVLLCGEQSVQEDVAQFGRFVQTVLGGRNSIVECCEGGGGMQQVCEEVLRVCRER